MTTLSEWLLSEHKAFQRCSVIESSTLLHVNGPTYFLLFSNSDRGGINPLGYFCFVLTNEGNQLNLSMFQTLLFSPYKEQRKCRYHTNSSGPKHPPSPRSPSSPSLICRFLGNSSAAVCHSTYRIFKMKSVQHEPLLFGFFHLAWVFWNSSISWLIYLILSYSSLCDRLYNVWLSSWFWWMAGPFPACV